MVLRNLMVDISKLSWRVDLLDSDTSKYSFLSWSHFKIHAQPPRSISLEQLIESRVILLELQLLGCAAISWSYKKQLTVAMSSSKAEYVAAASSACQSL
ncbi:hypothetical protein V6Z12_A08G078200 [Gossypium hirsutum]